MPRYRFNIIDGQKIMDPTGRHLANDGHAEQEAKSLAHGLRRGSLGEHYEAIEVVDESGQKIHKVPIHKRENEQD
jgi:hypothetical protein